MFNKTKVKKPGVTSSRPISKWIKNKKQNSKDSDQEKLNNTLNMVENSLCSLLCHLEVKQWNTVSGVNLKKSL